MRSTANNIINKRGALIKALIKFNFILAPINRSI